MLFDAPDDDLVIARARKGDTAAMEKLYRTYEAPVYNLGRRILSRPEEAEEVMQETFLEVFRSLGRYRGECPLGFWIRKIAVSKALQRIRSRASRKEEPAIDDAGDASGENRPPGFQAGTILDRIRLEGALAQLSEVTRAVVWLHDVEGFTHEEISAFLKKTPSFSKSQLSRAHARLRGFLERGREDQPCMLPVTTY